MKRSVQIISLLLIVLVIFMIRIYSDLDRPVAQDVSLSSSTIKESVEQIEPAVQKVQAGSVQEKAIAQLSPPAEKNTAVIKQDLDAAIQVEAKTKLDIEEQEEGIKIVMISVYEENTDVIPLPSAKSSYSLSEIKGFHILGNWNETPLNLIVSSNYSDGSEKIHYLDWNDKHPNEFKLYEPLGYEAYVRVFDNEVQLGQFAVVSSSEEEFIALDLSLDAVTEYAFAR